jgi:Ankyrin repeats (many copies)
MLYTAVMMNNLESVKLLLEYGADPSAKNLAGQTPLLVLNIGLSLVGSAPLIPIQAMTLLATKKQFDLDQANAIRELLEEKGSPEKDMVDDISSRNDIDKIISNFKSGPKMGDFIGKVIDAWQNNPFDEYMDSGNTYARKMGSISDEYALWALSEALAEWDAKRKDGSISKEELPAGWSEFLRNVTGRLKGC